jgi:hypothetical protein
MFCPACKAEYRAGFTQCADCKVALVSELPKRTSPEAYVLLWRGEDPVFHDTLRGELANVGIEYADTPLEVYFRNSENLFNFKLGPRFGFVISVKTGYFAAARAIRERLLDREPADVALPESQREESGTPIDSSSFPLHWDPLTASVEIWTGRNLDRLHFLANSLREVGIPSRSLMEQRDLCLLVRAEDEPRARDIVRQVSEAVVPEESVLRPVADIWHDEPVRSYLFAWLPAVIFLGLGILAYTVVSNAGQIFTLDPLSPSWASSTRSAPCG